MYEVKGKTSNKFKFAIIVDDDGNCKWKLKDKSSGNRIIGGGIGLLLMLRDILKICEEDDSNISFRMKVKIPMIVRTSKQQSPYQWKSVSEYQVPQLNSGPPKVIKFSRVNNRDGEIYLLNTYLEGEIVEDEVLMSNDLTDACVILQKLLNNAIYNVEV